MTSLKETFNTFDAIKQWQADETIHPLTCATDSNHKILVPIMTKEGCILHCDNCGYRQTNIPDVVLKRYKDGKDKI